MTIISQFYGIVITMYYNETNGKHHIPHIHVRYNNDKIIYDFNANIIEGRIPLKQKRMVEAWIMIHKEELITLWENGEDVCPEDLYYNSIEIKKSNNKKYE